MSYLVGFILATAVFLFGRIVGLDRDRAFYPTVLAVVASYYALFAVTGGSMSALGAECGVVAVFVLIVVVGFKFTPWLIVAGLAAHGIFDYFHGRLIANPGVPAFWPMFCLTYDITAAAGLAWLLRRTPARPGP